MDKLKKMNIYHYYILEYLEKDKHYEILYFNPDYDNYISILNNDNNNKTDYINLI